MDFEFTKRSLDGIFLAYIKEAQTGEKVGMKKLHQFVTALICSVLLIGCASGITVRTSGFLDQESQSFASGARIYVAVDPKSENPLLDAEIGRKIELLLKDRGYQVSPRSEAQLILRYVYGIDQGKVMTDMVPEFRPGDVTYETGRYRTNGQEGTYSQYSTTAGYIAHVPVDKVVYLRNLTVKVFEVKDQDEGHPVWIGESRSSGVSEDLRSMIDYLLIGTFRSFGKDTQRVKTTVISTNDSEVLRLRGQ